MAFVIKDPSNTALNEKFIVNHISSKVIDAQRLRGGVYFVDSLPMTTTGKIRRTSVREIAQAYYDANLTSCE